MNMSVPSFRFWFGAAIIAALVAAIAPATASAVEPVRIVATGGRIGYTFYAPPLPTDPAAPPLTVFRQRTPHQLGGPIAEIQIGFMDWMYTDKTESTNASNDVTLTHAWLERASTGQVVALTFSGSRQLVLPMNSTTPVWLSDPVPSSVWTGAVPARDEVFWLHATGTIPAGGKVPVGTPSTYAGARFVMFAPANDPGTRDVGGPIPTIAGGATRTEGLPLVFLGRYTGPGHLAVIGVGDSILHGSGDSANPTAVISGYGFFNRAAIDAAGKNTLATFNLTRHGQTVGAWVTPGKQSRQTPFLQYANVLVEEYGTNDLGSAGGGSPATILANVEKVWTAARVAGVQKIIRTKLMPRTTSTDVWATFGNQTPHTNWGAGETSRDAINSGLQDALSAGKIDVLLDTLAVVGDPADNGRWLTNGSAKYTTTDGTHVSPTGNALLAAALRAALLSLTVDEDRGYAGWSGGVDWQGADSAPEADPNADGVSNLLAYALGLPPLAPVSPARDLPAVALDAATPGGPWISLVYRHNNYADDLAYSVETSADLADWNAVVVDGDAVVAEVADADPDGDGGVVSRRVRMRLAASDDRRFLRLRASFVSAAE